VNAKEAALWPLSIPYGAAARLRARAYAGGLLKQGRLIAKVISVGNLTVGGTGKTPMVLWIAERLATEGKRTAILTRGYRGAAGAESDEVQLLKARLNDRVKFGVGADRFASGRELAATGTGWFVLDDGFQHLQLARDADVVLIDALNPFAGGRLLPAGRMREPKTALSRADVIVITRSGYAPAVEAAVKRDSGAPIFYAQATLDSIRSAASADRDTELARPREKKWFAFCGIGNPGAFVADLRAWDISVVGQRFFRDHHRYTQAEMDEVANAARAAGADGLICTEKDRFNLAGVITFPVNVAYCRISLNVGRGDEFWAAVLAAVERNEPRKS
jgi:tetraacyldisaccharide 4'-kinase